MRGNWGGPGGGGGAGGDGASRQVRSRFVEGGGHGKGRKGNCVAIADRTRGQAHTPRTLASRLARRAVIGAGGMDAELFALGRALAAAVDVARGWARGAERGAGTLQWMRRAAECAPAPAA